MSARRAERILAVVLAVAGVLLLLSLFGVLGSPWPGGRRQTDERATIDPSLPEPVQTDDRPDTSEAEADSASLTEGRGMLPLGPNDPALLPAGGTTLRVWPAESALPLLRDVQRTAFSGREYGPEALAGITVILDPGHGGSDEGHGYFGATDTQPVFEKTITLKAAQMLADRLRALGADVLFTRTDDTDQSLFYRVAFAADFVLLNYEEEASLAGYDIEPIRPLRPLMSDVMRINQGSGDSGGRGIFGSIGTTPDLRLVYDAESQYGDVIFISLQTGFDADESARGARAVYMSNTFVQSVNNGYAANQSADALPPNYTMYNSEDRFRLAGLLQAHIAAQLPGLASAETDAVREEDMAVLRLMNLNSAVIELGMLSNADDRALLTDNQSLGTMANAMAGAVYQYFCRP